MKLDDKDVLLLKLLQADARQTNKVLSVKTGLSVTAVFERIRKMEREGIVSRYVALLDKKKINLPFQVFCHIRLVQHSRDYLTRFEAQVKQLEEVHECFHVSGDYDYILKIYVANMEAYREFMVSKLTTLDHIGSTHSSFVISEVKNSTAFSVKI
jgi:Lrp/AsnC family leucine-responsive transcriptional regulator